MKLTSKKHIVTKTYKTQAKFFKDIEVDDVLIFELELTKLEHGSNGIYVPKILVNNLTQHTKHIISQGNLMNRLKHLELLRW